MKRILTALLILGAWQLSVAQISFTNQVSILTDPTHYSGNAVTVQDVNGDGLDDLVILDNARDLRIEYQNLDGTWTSYSGGEMGSGNAWGMVVADTDNNGYADIFSGLSGGNPDYAKANADGTAWEINDLEGYGLFYQGSSLGDFDGDGDLDLYVCADTDESAIWENDGLGNMAYSDTNLIDLTVEGWDGSGNYGSTITDFDLDGDLDLYISHCRQGVNDASDPRRINQLFENDGNNNYTENAAAYGLNIGSQTWTTDFGDIDNDGDFDMFLTNHDVNNMLLENIDGSDQYQDIYNQSGLTNAVGLPIQGVMRDFDNDMYLDIFVTGNEHALYMNNGDKTFTPVSGAFTGGDIESYATGDINHDGFIDIYASYADIFNQPSNTPDAVWVNDGNDNNFITVVLEGTISNRSAVGTVVRAYGPWGMQVREARSGESYGMVNSLHQHFGLAQNTVVDSIVVDWPTSGIHQVIENPAINQFVTIVENQCVAPVAMIVDASSAVLCPGGTLDLEALTASGQSYLWSTGESTPMITVTDPGVYMLQVTDDVSGCAAISASVSVIVGPDETPSISADGDVDFCEGTSVVLTSSESSGYLWSDGSTTQSIEVVEAGEYTVSVMGLCQEWTSEVISVSVLDAPMDVPMADDVVIPSGTSANLTATGSGNELRWFDAEVAGNLLAVGPTYDTEVLVTSTSFWVESVNSYFGGTAEGGRADNSPDDGQYHPNAGFYLLFDADQDFILNSVKVYAEDEGERTIRLMDDAGNEVATYTETIDAGESVVQLDFLVEAGTNYSLRGTDDPGLWRDDDEDNVNFPYDLGGVGSITGTNVSQDNADRFYYFFYDWQISLPELSCASPREEVIVEIAVGLVEGDAYQNIRTYPNPTEGALTVEFGHSLSDVQVELIDLTGKVILADTWTKLLEGEMKVLDLQGLASGSYVLRLISEEGMRTEKIRVK
jgi:hypothetical protein